jgi:protein TonB
MDPVSQILADRERSAPRMLPWVVLAATLHGLVVAAAFLYGRTAAARPAHLPVVSVKLIRPDRPPGGPALASKPRPAAAAPAPRPTAAATAVPRPQPTAPSRSRASDKAMAAPKPATTPVPTEAAGPEATGAGGGSGGGSSSGLSLGEGDGGQVAGVPADFHFTYYIERMLALIESRWYKPAVAAGTRARVRFRIQRDGRLDTIEIEESSGHPSFDRAALRALYASNPLPPLPPAYTQPSLTVHLSFAE